MLNRIRVRGYKSLRDLDVQLKPLTLLFGPNAAVVDVPFVRTGRP